MHNRNKESCWTEAALRESMERAGYRGVLDLELIGPRIDQEGHLNAVRRAADNVGEMLRSLGA